MASTLAINRGEKEKFLSVKIDAPVDEIIGYLIREVVVRDNPNTNDILKDAIADSYERLIAPSIERDIRNSLTEAAEDGAIFHKHHIAFLHFFLYKYNFLFHLFHFYPQLIYL